MDGFLRQSIPIVRAIRRFSVIFNQSGITKMVHSLLTKSFPAIFCIINVIIRIYELNNVVNTNPLIIGLIPFVIRPYMS